MRLRTALIPLLLLVFGYPFISRGQTQPVPPPTYIERLPQDKLFEAKLFIVFRHPSPPMDPHGREPIQRALLADYQRKARLEDYQVKLLADVAKDWAAQTELIDEKAQPMVKEFRARMSEEFRKGNRSPLQPPAELLALEGEKTTISKQSVTRLHDGLGEEAFNRLAKYMAHPNPVAKGEGEQISSFQVRVPDALARPAPAENRIQRPDFDMPKESLYHSMLPVKIMIRLYDSEGRPRNSFHAEEQMVFKVSLLNTVKETARIHLQEVMESFMLHYFKQGERPVPRRLESVLFETIPPESQRNASESPLFELPFNTPVEVGVYRFVPQEFGLNEGRYAFNLKRPLALVPAGNKHEDEVNLETSRMTLDSNMVEVAITP